MRIVLLGGSGFIGSRLAPKLIAAGHSVLIGDRQRSAVLPDAWQLCDVTDAASLQDCLAGADLVYNLAAVHQDDVRPLTLYHDVNVLGARNVCEAADHCGVKRIVFTSSVAIYGSSPHEQDESSPTQPEHEYGRTKLQAEEIYREWFARSPGRTLTVIRPTAVFGEGNRGNLYQLLRLIARRRFFVVGSGRNVKSVAYVENVAAFLAFLAQREPGEATFNYADKPDFTMNELVVAVRRVLGRKPSAGTHIPYVLALAMAKLFDFAAWITGCRFAISGQRIAKFVSTTQFSAQKALATGFRPEVSLEEGLRRTLEFEFPDSNKNDRLPDYKTESQRAMASSEIP